MELAAVLLMFAVIALVFYRVISRNPRADARIGKTPQVRRRPF